jgi:hypothetical protein
VLVVRVKGVVVRKELKLFVPTLFEFHYDFHLRALLCDEHSGTLNYRMLPENKN